MGILTDRVKDGVESLAESWGERLFGWMLRVISGGATKWIDENEPEALATVHDSLAKLKESPNVRPELKAIIDRIDSGGHPIPLLLAIPIAVILFIPTIFSIAQPLGNLLTQQEEKYLRTSRLDPAQAITAWRRNKDKFAKFLEDADLLGWSEERKELWEEITRAYPSLRDVIGFYAHEVFEEDLVQKYGLRDELPPYEGTLFEKIGVDPEVATNYWIDHWDHPPLSVIIELLHRGLIDEAGVFEYFKLIERPPYWRDLEIQSYYTWPTRVDVRRFYDLHTIDDTRLREIYMGMGYRGKNLEDYILWTRIYVRLPDLLARWKNGWITLDQVKVSLVGYGMTEESAQELIETKVSATEPTTTTDVKKLTIAQIIRWVKIDEVNRYSMGLELIKNLHYTEEQADFIMEGYLGEMGSPETYDDFMRLTDKYRKAAGLEVRSMPEELKQAASDLKQVSDDLNLLREDLKKFLGEIIDVQPYPEEVEKQKTELEAKVADAERALAYARTTYETELAKWRHTQTP